MTAPKVGVYKHPKVKKVVITLENDEAVTIEREDLFALQVRINGIVYTFNPVKVGETNG